MFFCFLFSPSQRCLFLIMTHKKTGAWQLGRWVKINNYTRWMTSIKWQLFKAIPNGEEKVDIKRSVQKLWSAKTLATWTKFSLFCRLNFTMIVTFCRLNFRKKEESDFPTENFIVNNNGKTTSLCYNIVTRNNIVWKLACGYCLCYCKTFSLVPDSTECTKIFVTEKCGTLFTPPKIK